MQIRKSSRHSKITGDFCEAMVLYYLSKHGFECARVDHTGIDLIARNPHTKELMGISVKGRSRQESNAERFVLIKNDNFEKVQAACEAFICVPYFAIVVEGEGDIWVFVLSMKKLLRLYERGKTSISWKMSKEAVEGYLKDPEIIAINFNYQVRTWWPDPEEGAL